MDSMGSTEFHGLHGSHGSHGLHGFHDFHGFHGSHRSHAIHGIEPRKSQIQLKHNTIKTETQLNLKLTKPKRNQNVINAIKTKAEKHKTETN